MPDLFLALDLSTRTGWAVGPIAPPAPTPMEAACGQEDAGAFSGVKTFPACVPEIFTVFEKWLDEMVQVHKPLGIVCEAPLPAKAQRSNAAATINLGLANTLVSYCKRRRIWHKGLPNSTVKKHATGNGRAKKPEMMKAAEERGWPADDDNRVDALWVLDCARAKAHAKKKDTAA